MEVDATRTGKTSEDYRRFMTGRCYGCGSKSHRKADGNHERDVCGYGGITGHLASVCRCKYLGLTGQTGTRNISATSTITEPPTSTVAASSHSPAVPDLAQVLQQLAANQQSLAAQIAELRQNF